ncbi:MAG: alpha/beta hydrolase [Acidobacteriaceae bacterium]|nr:alpha/beta hydrolase [Acidobacteriaceae bacterium]MBV9500932.1 alpha/beta hydrolase [Acidobacteriaceae bacterium]
MNLGIEIGRCGVVAATILLSGVVAFAAEPQVQFVDVGDSVKLEVLDWGGTGRPIILLAGSGNTAHIYEGFAPKLTDCGHVYGITRRGYGASSKPERGYSVPELSEDVWRVIQSLKLSKPVVIGHSMAGSELSFLGQKHSAQLGALIYLDANADPMDFPWSNAEFRALTMKSMKGAVGPPKPTDTDKASIEAYRNYQKRIGMPPFPANEIRNIYDINPDGSVGKNRTPPFVSHEIDDGSIRKDYTGINIPVLALIAVPPSPSEQSKEQPPKDQQERADSARLNEILLEYIQRWETNLKRADPRARIVELPGAHHYLFLNEEADVLREIRAFLQTLN